MMDHARLTYLALYEGDKLAAAELERRKKEIENPRRRSLAASDDPPKPPRATAEIKRLLCMANATYDPKALDALTRALVAQGFGR